MKLRQLLLSAMLLAAGYVLHLVVTPFTGGMKFDLLLSTLFVALLIVPNFEINLPTGILAGLIAAATTTFPGGQIPNLIDKLVVTIVLYGLIRLLASRLPKVITATIVATVGTLLSGAVFLGSALLITGLPVPFPVLFLTVVIPATLANCVLTVAMITALAPVTVKYGRLLSGEKIKTRYIRV